MESVEEIALGAITVELTSEVIKEFDEYFKKLLPPTLKSSHRLHKPAGTSYQINTRNPWFKDYW